MTQQQPYPILREKTQNATSTFIAFCVFALVMVIFIHRCYTPSTPSVEPSPVLSTQQKIDNQFSAWDGSHHKLTRMIKQSLRSPGSYKHIQTSYANTGRIIRVRTVFQGQNAFGVMLQYTAYADFDYSGNQEGELLIK